MDILEAVSELVVNINIGLYLLNCYAYVKTKDI